MKISVFGSGYVGLVTGTCFSEMGHTVFCIDVDENKINRLQKGKIPFYEPGLQELVLRNVKENRLFFSTNSKEGIEHGEIIFSAVGTPPQENHEADLRYVKMVAHDFGEYLNGYKIFILKSTVPVGTSDFIREEILKTIQSRKNNQKISFDVVSNPEFLREGTAVKDFMNPDRIIVGLNFKNPSSEKVKMALLKIYNPVVRVGSPLVFTDLRSAEIIKYASNAFLATKISFINEIANFCDHTGGDIKEIAKGMGLDKRISSRFLHAGIGYGGSCFPKDVQALIQIGKKHGCPFSILESVEAVNHYQRSALFKKIKNFLPSLKEKKIAIWGLSFKPKTDDMREAPSIDVLPILHKEGASLQVFDPIVPKERVLSCFPSLTNLTVCKNAYEACVDAEALIILTEWDEFRAVDFTKLKSLMKTPQIIDGRNLYERSEVEEAGFRYTCFGR